MRVLYLIQTFKDLPQIVRLVQTIRRSDPSGIVWITHNSEAFTIKTSAFRDLTNVYVMNVPSGSRLDFSLVDSYISALERAWELGIQFDWVINLTGQCYPVRPLREFANLLSHAQVDAFIFYRKVFDENGNSIGIWPNCEAKNRYHYQYYWRLRQRELPWMWRKVLGPVRILLQKVQPWIRLDSSYGLQIGLRDRSSIIGPDFQLFGGMYYMTLSYRAAHYLCEFTRSHPEIKAYFSRMNTPSEVYPHTVLANNSELRVSPEPHVFMDTAMTKRGRPVTLETKDLDRIFASGKFFARKFDPKFDSTVLDHLDQKVLEAALGPLD